ncbi:MAG: hypothetical protein J6S81_06515 [Treponema sp.]|nr:hypothetical protein [Treponema sp.]
MSTRTKKLILDCTQQRVYDFIKEHGSITTQQANKELGETRLSARIFELKEKGVNIQDEWLWVKNRYGEKRHVKKYFIGRGRK